MARQPSRSLSVIDQVAADSSDVILASPQEMPTGLSLVQVASILRFYWVYTMIIALVIVLFSSLVIKFLPKTYIATATLILAPGKNDPLGATTIPNDQMQLTSHVATQVEIIQSPVILGRVVDQLQLTKDPEFTVGFVGSDPGALREYAERNLAQSLKVDLGRGNELVYIAAAARSPVKAALIANTIAQTYMAEEEARLAGPAGDQARRYSEDLTQLRAKVEAAQDTLNSFLQKQGITDLDQSHQTTDTESLALVTLEQHLLDAQNQRRALEANSTGEESVANEALSSQIIQQLKTQLATEQNKLAQLGAIYGAEHPKMVEVKNQLARTQQQLDDAYRTLAQNNSTQLQRARELESRYTQAVADQRTKVMKLRERQGEGAKLALELDSAQSVYKRALDGYDHFLFASADKSSDVSLVSSATPPVKATYPNKPKLLAASMLAGLAFGVALPFLYEMLFSRRVRCSDDLERSLGLPVLAQFDSFGSVSSST